MEPALAPTIRRGVFELLTKRLVQAWRSEEPGGRGYAYRCDCGRPVYFRNSLCLGCKAALESVVAHVELSGNGGANRLAIRQMTGNRFTRPLLVGSGLLVALMGFGLLGIFVLLQGAATGYAMLTRDLPSLSAISNHASFKTAQIFDRNGTLLWEFYDPDGGKRAGHEPRP